MPAPEPEIAHASLVFVGAMNPTILQPAWLAAHGLIREEEGEAAEIRIIHPDVVAYSLDWVDLEVTSDRCMLQTTSTASSAEPMRDLAVGIFSILTHTPIRLVGINSDAHYHAPSQERWHEIGHALAPDKPWSKVLGDPGMRSLTMEGTRPDGRHGWIRMTVEPSARVNPGLFVAVNDHYDLTVDEPDAPRTAAPALDVVKDRWPESAGLQALAAQTVFSV